MYVQATCLLSVLALSISQAQADVYIEVAPTFVGPDGATNGGAVIGGTEAISVWIWADSPGTSIWTISLDLDGRSRQGIPSSGGDYAFSGVGVADPDENFFDVLSHGTFADQYTISNIEIMGDIFAGGTELPTSIGDAFVLYTDFSGTPMDVFSGVMPIVEIGWGGNAPQTVHTYGWYQTPTPSGAMTIGLGLLIGARRRR